MWKSILGCGFLLCAVLAQDDAIPDRLDLAAFKKYQICGPAVVEQCFRDMDANGDGIVTQAERDAFYAKEIPRIEAMNRQTMEKKFAAADTDGDGLISLQQAARAESLVPNAAFLAFARTMDADGDGQLNKEEFARLDTSWYKSDTPFEFTE